jgi:hypothetical protein
LEIAPKELTFPVKTLSVAKSFFVIAILLFSNSSFAQSFGNTTGTLFGETSDDTGAALSGVLITVTGQDGEKTALTDSEGKYIFPYLIPARYKVRAELPGFTTVEQNEIRIALGQRLEISFQMRQTIRESVTVKSEPPIVDLSNTATGVNISDQLTRRIPIGRSLTDIVNLAPGVVKNGLDLFISGGSRWDNTFIVDGAVVTNPGFGGLGTVSFNQTDGNLRALGGNGLPLETIQEVQVITGGFEPEYGEAQGGIIHVITKSGTNNLHGEGYTYVTPQTSSDRLTRGDYGIDAGMNIGGPVFKNKLFFYTGYNRTTSKNTFFLQPDYPAYSQLKEVSEKVFADSYSMKLTADLTSQNTIEFSAFGDPSHSPLSNHDGDQLDSSLNPLLVQSKWNYGSHTQTLRWSSILKSTMFVEAQAGHYQNEYLNTPDEAQKDVPRIFDPEHNNDLGGMGGNIDFFSRNLQYSLKFTNLWRNHQFRYGMEFEDISFSADLQRTGGPLKVFNGQVATEGCKVDKLSGSKFNHPELPYIYQAGCLLTSSIVPTSTKYLDWFAQDSWNLTPALTVTLGIRWEKQHLQGDREGSNGVTFNNSWAPRIGATYDYRKNGNSKLFFHYGRFYEKIPNYVALQFTPSISAFSYFQDPELTQVIPDLGELSMSKVVEIEGHGNSTSPYHTSAQYSNEWVAGIEQEVQPGFSLGAHLIFRNLKNVLDFVLVNPESPCIPLTKGGCFLTPITLEDLMLELEQIGVLSNLDGHVPGVPALTRNYKAIEIIAEKRLSNRWQVMGSYTYARLIGNFEGRDPFVLGPAGQIAISPLTKYLYASGPLSNDIRHRIKLFGSYELFNKLNTGLAFYFQTGRPISAFADPFFHFIAPRGAHGRTDSITSVDVNVNYSINVFGSSKMTLGLDIFNLFNAHGVTAVDEVAEVEGFLNRNFLHPTDMQPSRSIRVLLRYSF